MIFQRLRVLWLGFWSKLIGSHESKHHATVAQGLIESHKRQLHRLREALTGLIFQSKRLQDQKNRLEKELLELQKDIHDAAKQNRDDLALKLIARMEAVQEESAFISNQLTTLDREVETAKATEKYLSQEIAKAEQMIGTLTSRHQALEIRKRMQLELNSLVQVTSGAQAKLSEPLAEQIQRLEAELAVLHSPEDGWEREWQSLREQRTKDRHEDLLRQIKGKLHPKHLSEPASASIEPMR